MHRMFSGPDDPAETTTEIANANFTAWTRLHNRARVAAHTLPLTSSSTMFDVTIETPSGQMTFSYVISTPTKTVVERIPTAERSLPTVVFLHPVYIGKLIWHRQFASRQLRRFNLVALDLRGHGRTVGAAGAGYGREVAATDVGMFMEALEIPRYHIFGMSMGGCIGIQTAISFPDAVQSVFVVSSLSLTEPPDVADGRREMITYLMQISEEIEAGAMLDTSPDSPSAARVALMGAMQLSANGEPSPFITAAAIATLAETRTSWKERMKYVEITTVDFFVKRSPFTIEALKKIKCPVQLVHCSADIAYSLESTEQVAGLMREAGVEVDVQQVSGAPHFGAATHPNQINTLFHRFILSRCTADGAPPPIPQKVESPFASTLSGFESDDDSDREYFV
ncbi:AB hydrolase-1 domain-containing protein [Mycena kentingensis (nom. inval.)]|nr:AB hydrolase-1 domain-containing protein [Mycena kentingensis (nom. inval.)]